MKVTTEIDVTPKQYFKHLCEITIKDIKKSNGKDVTIADLMDGYHYEKTLTYKKRSIIIAMNVGPLIMDKYFSVAYETSETKCVYYYDFFIRDGKNYVTYCEDNNYKKETVGNYFGNLRRKFKEKTLKNKIFNNIELTTTYIKNHEN